MKTFSDNHVKCNKVLKDCIVGIIKSILKHPLDTPEWSVKRYPILIPRSEVPPLQITGSKQVSEIPYINLNESFEELPSLFNITENFIPILVNSGFDQPLSIPILAVCESNKCVFMFAQKKHATKYMPGGQP